MTIARSQEALRRARFGSAVVATKIVSLDKAEPASTHASAPRTSLIDAEWEPRVATETPDSSPVAEHTATWPPPAFVADSPPANDQQPLERLQRLLPVPGAAVLGAQRAHDADQLLEPRPRRLAHLRMLAFQFLMPARVTVLGSGTSHGVPMIGCTCAVCRSDDRRDRRTRPSIYVEFEQGPSILVDTSTDLRHQALANGVTRV